MSSPSGGGLTDEQIEGILNRLETRHSTKVNARTAIAGAVIAALIGVGAALGGAEWSADRQDALADETFAREQRIETYGEFLGAIDASNALLRPFLPNQRTFVETPWEEFDPHQRTNIRQSSNPSLH